MKDRNGFGGLHILVLTETHLMEEDLASFPHNFMQMTWIHHVTNEDDPAAGISLGYSNLLPPPEDTSSVLLAAGVRHPQLILSSKIIMSRAIAVTFTLSTVKLVVGGLYGYVAGSKHVSSARYYLMRDVHNLLNMVKSKAIIHGYQSQDVVVVLGGDFNAFPTDKPDPDRFYSTNRILSNCPSRVCKQFCEKCGYKLFINPASLLPFTHFADLVWMDGPDCKSIRPPLLPKYLTNIVKSNADWTRTGIDHILIDNAHIHCVTKGWNGNLGSTLTHNLIKVALSNVWENPLPPGKLTQSSPYKQIPNYLFHDASFALKVKTRIDALVQLPIDTTDWSIQWDNLIHWCQLKGVKAANQIYNELQHNVSKLKLQLHELYLKSADKIGNVLHSEYIQVHAALVSASASKLNAEADRYLVNVSDDPEVLDAIHVHKEQLDDTNRHRAAANFICGFKKSNGDVITKHEDLLVFAADTFKAKYSFKDPKPTVRRRQLIRFLKKSILPKLTHDQSAKLDSPYTSNELLVAMEYLSASSDSPTSTGMDMIPSAFFTNPLLAGVVSELLSRILNFAVKTGRLPTSMLSVAYRLLQKDGKDPLSILDKRPICLMSIAFRILSRAIGLRMNDVMEHLIHTNQRAYIRNRRMDHNSAILSALLHKCANDSMDKTMALEADFSCAFDSVQHDYMKEVFRAFGFGPIISRLIMLFITKLSGQVIINGALSYSFKIQRGTPQGCFLSCLLFLLALEPLLARANQDPLLVRGFELSPGQWISYLAYADDLWTIISSPEQLGAWLSILHEAKPVTGLNLNMLKTHAHLLGGAYWNNKSNSTSSNAVALDMTRRINLVCGDLINSIKVAADFKYVGVEFSPRNMLVKGKDLHHSSWDTRINKIKLTAKALWYTLSSTSSFQLRCNVAHEKLLSQITFLARPTKCPSTLVAGLQKALNSIVYGGSGTIASVKLHVASLDAGLGGFSMPNMEIRLLALSTDWLVSFLLGTLPISLDTLLFDNIWSVLLPIVGGQLACGSAVCGLLAYSKPISRITLIDMLSMCGGLLTQSGVARVFPPWQSLLLEFHKFKCNRYFLTSEDEFYIGSTNALSDQCLINIACAALEEPLFYSSLMFCHFKNLGIVTNPTTATLSFLIMFKKLGLNTISDIWSTVSGSVDVHDRILNRIANTSNSIRPFFSYLDWAIFAPTGWLDLYPSNVNQRQCNNIWSRLIPPTIMAMLCEIDRRQLGSRVVQYSGSVQRTQSDKLIGASSYSHLLFYIPSLKNAYTSALPIRLVKLTTKVATQVLVRVAHNSKPLNDHIPAGQIKWNEKMIASGLSQHCVCDNPCTCPFPDILWVKSWALTGRKRWFPKSMVQSYFALLHRLNVPSVRGWVLPPRTPNSNWSTCHICGEENNPMHGIYTCPGVAFFWRHLGVQLKHFVSTPDKVHPHSVISLPVILSMGESLYYSSFPNGVYPDPLRFKGVQLIIITGIHAISRFNCLHSNQAVRSLTPRAHSSQIFSVYLKVLSGILTKRVLRATLPLPSPELQHNLFLELYPFVRSLSDVDRGIQIIPCEPHLAVVPRTNMTKLTYLLNLPRLSLVISLPRFSIGDPFSLSI